MKAIPLRAAFAAACMDMPDHTEELCRLDGYIGDGDHGVTISRGFEAAAAAVREAASARDVFVLAGDALGERMGGAIGPIYGMFFRSIGKRLGEDVAPGDLKAAWESGLSAVMRIGRAEPGGKTVVDAILPSARAAEGHGSLAEALAAMGEAALEGARATEGMRASKGRARFLGEQSVGHMDPGAYSYALFMGHLARRVGEQEAMEGEARK